VHFEVVLDVYVTALPDDAEAIKENVLPPKILSGMSVNEIV
jgi:hypothetical protein